MINRRAAAVVGNRAVLWKHARNGNKKMTGNVMIGFLRKAFFALICLLSLAAGVTRSSAADYPNRPVHWLIGFAAGGPVDIVARIMSQWLSDRFGQQFIVENRTGSGGNIAAAAAISSPPDGYTLLFVAPNNAISTSLYKKLPYDFIRDTVPVASIMQLTNLMVVPMGTAGEHRPGVHRLLQGQSRQDFLCILRQRHLGAYVGGVVQGAYQGRDDACALSGFVGGDARPDLQQGAGAVRQLAFGVGTGARRHAARARRHLAKPLARRAGHPGGGRDRAGIRVSRLLRHLHAKRHAAGDRRYPQQGDRRGP